MSLTRSHFGCLLAALALPLLVGCGRKDDPANGAKDEPVALSRPAEIAETAKPVATAPVAPPKKDGTTKVQDPAPQDDAEDSAEDGDDEAASADDDEGEKPTTSKKRRGKSNKAKSRKRSSSSSEPQSQSEPKVSSSEERPAREGQLTLKRIQFAGSVANREPVDPEETFAAGETDKLYAFIELANPSSEKSKITVTFVPPMGAATKVTLDVGDKVRWRTWAQRKNVKAVGTWKVIVKDESGRELGHRSFEVTE